MLHEDNYYLFFHGFAMDYLNVLPTEEKQSIYSYADLSWTIIYECSSFSREKPLQKILKRSLPHLVFVGTQRRREGCDRETIERRGQDAREI